MKKTLMTAVVLSLATVTTSFASDAVVPPAPVAVDAVTEQGEEAIVRGQSDDVVVRAQSRRRNGFFSRLMELERRKNAWLRRTFLDR